MTSKNKLPDKHIKWNYGTEDKHIMGASGSPKDKLELKDFYEAKVIEFSITFKPTGEFLDWAFSLPASNLPMKTINDYNRNKWK